MLFNISFCKKYILIKKVIIIPLLTKEVKDLNMFYEDKLSTANTGSIKKMTELFIHGLVLISRIKV